MQRVMLTSLATLSLCLMLSDAALAGGVRFHRQNAQGGVTVGAFHNNYSANGGHRIGGHAVKTDGQGNAVGGSGACISGAGGSGCRQGSFTKSADGNASRQGSASYQGTDGGSVSTQGSVSRSTDGAVSGARNTTASGPNGGTYTGETTYSSGQGFSHSATCTDGSGAAVACPSR